MWCSLRELANIPSELDGRGKTEKYNKEDDSRIELEEVSDGQRTLEMC